MGVHVGVDVGGTFTDLFAVDSGDGSVLTEKTDTTADAVSGVIEAIRQSGIDAGAVESLVFGSTIATNALVQDTVEPVAFLGTEGFTDILETRRLWRQHLFGWKWDRCGRPGDRENPPARASRCCGLLPLLVSQSQSRTANRREILGSGARN